MNDKMAWYVSRSSGWVAFALLAITVVWGILGITKVIERKGLPRWMMDLHKYVALLTLVFTGVHLAALVADNFVHIAWREILVPYALDWKPGAVTFGIVALYVLLVVQVLVVAPASPASQGVEGDAHAVVSRHVAGRDARVAGGNRCIEPRCPGGRDGGRGLDLVVHLAPRAEGQDGTPHRARHRASRLAETAEMPDADGDVDSSDYLVHVQQAMDSLRHALDKLRDLGSDELTGRERPVPAERRRATRTLVDDVLPPP